MTDVKVAERSALAVTMAIAKLKDADPPTGSALASEPTWKVTEVALILVRVHPAGPAVLPKSVE